MIKIAVAGAAGKMGGRITALSKEYEGIQLAGVFERKGHADIGKDIGTLTGIGELGISLSSGIGEIIDKVDLIIDFTSVEATKENLKIASNKGKAMVIGTTGFSREDLKEIEALAKTIPCVLASNMSLGVNLLLKVLQDIAGVLGDDYDIEIVEAHHRLKKDAPSGTALKMAQVIADALNRNLEEVAVYARKGIIGQRTKKEIGIQTVRAGDIVGEHTVIFGGLGERIEITHRASSRDTFARGALKAALWLAGKPSGLYDMQNVLGLR
ncbi:MAG: 4-hydroxy-tetrahydrodipicolinate reductase [Nitrospira bacterium HGW-Nitrospira-1]|nr:MAG: 4-hydroxy-tetrahydrodipicolinate reductase [Nitrospira bacterium HGW-Nitrospira-1]